MSGDLYPLSLDYPITWQARTEHLHVVVDRNGWKFADPVSQGRFLELPAAKRLEFRSAFEAQVTLAKSTPTA